MSLDINKSYKAIIKAAREGRFISYGDVAAASEVEWKKARRPLPQHLDEFVRILHERGWPLISTERSTPGGFSIRRWSGGCRC